MSSSFTESFDQLGGDSPGGSTRPFDDGYLGYDPRLPSQRFDPFSNFAESESVKGSAAEDSPIFTSQSMPDTPSPRPIYVSGGGLGSDPAEFSSFSPQENGEPFGGYAASNGPILPPPVEMQPEEGFALREWRRQNATRLEEKEKKEKEALSEIIDEADEYKNEFYRKRQIGCETAKVSNREKEQLYISGQEKFHAEADKHYWKAIAELIPNEVPTIEKKRGKKDQDKKPSIVVIQGPKPGKATDLSRMRQILLKLKHNTPDHLKHCAPPAPENSKDGKSDIASSSGIGAAKAVAVAISPETVAVA